MRSLWSFYRRHKIALLLIVLLLFGQAVCDLALPDYTSKILNVGLQQSGIENGVMVSVRADSLSDLELFTTDSETETVESAYTEADAEGIRTLREDADTETLNDALLLPECIVYAFENYADAMPAGLDLDTVRQGVESGAVTKEQIRTQAEERLASVSESTATYETQIAVRYVEAEYEAQGISVTDIQSRYLAEKGLQMVLLAVAMTVFSILTNLVSSITAARIGRGLRGDLFRKVLSFTPAETEKFSTASLITRSTNDIQQIQMVCAIMTRFIIYSPILAAGGIVMVVRTTTGMSWIIVLAVVVLLALVGILMGVTMPKFRSMQKLIDRVNLVSREILTGIMPIRAFCRESYEEERFDRANTDLFRTQRFTNRAMAIMMPAMMFLMNGVSVLIVWVSASRIDSGYMQIGEMTAFLTYAMLIVMSFLIIAMVAVFLPRAGVAADRVVEVLQTKSSIEDPAEPRDGELENAKGVVEFCDVGFRYPDAEEYVLEHISFRAEPGRTTAVIGATGSGKTSIINLLERFYDVTEGTITVDGVDIREITRKKLHSLIGYVPQKSVLFSGTIAENLKYAGADITDERMRKAAQIAQAEDFILEKPDGYDAPIARGGTNVSGGQKQRLSIARALAKEPRIYLFDDSFSALDFRTDRALRAALREEVRDATIVIVAQRISTILHADQILVLDDGRIVGCGTHRDLMHSCTVYREIAESQLSEQEIADSLAEGGDADA